MTRKITIDQRLVTDETDCYIIAEIGHNHQGEMDKARELIKAAKDCGADAVKTQKRDNRNLFTKAYFDRPYDNPNSFGKTYGEHREFLEFGKSEFAELKAYADEIGITFFATAFDEASADFLSDLDMPAYKIASGDLRNLPLIEYVASLGKPMIVSVGGGSIDDAQRVYDTVMPVNPQLALLQCTMSYPTEPSDMNLRVIGAMRDRFPDVTVGFSDHYNGIAMASAAFVLGARVIEKHFTLNHTWKGTDHALSLEPIGFRKMVRDLQRINQGLGSHEKTCLECEKGAIQKMGKALVAATDLESGTVLDQQHIAARSPGGDGLPPSEITNLLGQELKVPMRRDQAFAIEHVNGKSS